MNIRSSSSADAGAILKIHLSAFDEDEASAVAQLALDLLDDPTAEPSVSLVAEQDGVITGHVVFSHVMIPDVHKKGIYILSPLAVAPDQQCQGTGTSLIRTGIDLLKSMGAQIVMVYGDPDYYGRVGFIPDHNIQAPFPLEYPHGWLALELQSGALETAQGIITCPKALRKPEIW